MSFAAANRSVSTIAPPKPPFPESKNTLGCAGRKKTSLVSFAKRWWRPTWGETEEAVCWQERRERVRRPGEVGTTTESRAQHSARSHSPRGRADGGQRPSPPAPHSLLRWSPTGGQAGAKRVGVRGYPTWLPVPCTLRSSCNSRSRLLSAAARGSPQEPLPPPHRPPHCARERT